MDIDPHASNGELSDDELVEALAPLSLRSTLDIPKLASSAGRRVDEPSSFADLVAHYRSALFESPFAAPAVVRPDGHRELRRTEVAASVVFQAVVAHVANVVLLAGRVLGVGVQPRPGDIRWRADGWGTRFGLAEIRRSELVGMSEVLSRLGDEVVEPLLTIVGPHAPVVERVLRGNARAAMWTAVVAAHSHVPLTDRERDEIAALDVGPTRDTCCGIHLAGLVACDECPRAPAETQPEAI